MKLEKVRYGDERGTRVVTVALWQELGVSAEELQVMLGVVSWATCGAGPAGQSRAREGRRAKALLDWARARWLRAQGFAARLCHFVPEAVSPENVCIVATR